MSFGGPIEDRLAIRELIDSYADAVNRFDAVAWEACWTEESRWSLPGYDVVDGRARIVAMWSAAMPHFLGIVFVASVGAIEVEGDQATMRSYTSEVYTDQATGICHRDLGAYQDDLVRDNGRWLFSSRVFRHLHQG